MTCKRFWDAHQKLNRCKGFPQLNAPHAQFSVKVAALDIIGVSRVSTD